MKLISEKINFMGNTYTQLHVHAVFAAQNRLSIINEKWEKRVYEYIAGIIRSNGHKPLIVNGMPDHIHSVFGLRPNQSISELLEAVKGSSSKWINENHFAKGKFNWQKGFGAFSYSRSQLPRLIKYVSNQKEHHKRKSFLDEYIEILNKFEVDYNPIYIFHNPYSV
jgi:REP element-mobilizing transposase RayT